ncbi:DUF4097 family beta strand repeat-containing protein [Bacillus sp. 2205SS5-2]|uniref:DUF4097 family beta strand repeat-containing protein n=1 Tax=Bacillus sp. 2205SS5-2 TaxID=3109031 RepID=UPI0030070A6B
MTEERKRILEMVENGSLSAREALTLLEALDSAEETSKKKEEKLLNDLVIAVNKEKKTDGPTGSSTKEKLMEFISSTIKKVKDMDLDFQLGQHADVSHVFQHTGVTVQQLELDISNGKVEIIPWDQQDVRIECNVRVYRTEKQEEARTMFLKNTTFSIENDKLRFSTQFKWMKADTILYIPKNEYEKLSVRIFNGGLTVKGLQVEDFKFKTANGKLNVEQLYSQSLEAETANGSISIVNSYSRKIEAETINGSITFKGDSQKLDLQSLNGNIQCDVTGDQCETLHAKTVTGSVVLAIGTERSLSGELKSNLGSFKVNQMGITILEEKSELVQKYMRFSKKGLNPHMLHVFADTKTGSISLK